MPDIPKTGLVAHVKSGVDPGAALGGTSIPSQEEMFGSTSHITPSIATVEVPSHMQTRPITSVHIQ